MVSLGGLAQEASAAYEGANGKIAFESDRTRGKGVNNPTGDSEIFVMKPDGSGVTQLTDNTAEDFDPTFSADGEVVLFSTNRDGNQEIYVMNADGSKQANRTNATETDATPDWGIATP
jgi:TolB protein